MITKIMVTTDGSDVALRAVQYAAFLGKKLGCPVTLAHVVEYAAATLAMAGTGDESRRMIQIELRGAGKAILEQSQKPLSEVGINPELQLLEGRPGEAISKYAQENNIDLIIIGNRGRGKISRALLGSVSDEVVRNAHCPVMVVR